VDGTWTVPHFEKMLYDNALLQGCTRRRRPCSATRSMREIAGRTAEYLAREMTHAEGGLFSAQDAEVDGREGLNYLWTEDEAGAVLGEPDASFAESLYGFGAGGNFTDPHHPGDGAKTVLRLEDRPETLAARAGIDPDGFGAQRARVNAALLRARGERPAPGLDDKVIASWNGMAIVGLVEAAASLGEASHTDAAERAARFVLGRMRDAGGGLFRSCRIGADGALAVGPAGTLEDHAWMIAALVRLHEAGRGGGEFLDAARSLADAVDGLFADGGGLYTDAATGWDDLFVHARSTYDGATPSGLGVMIRALVGLHRSDPSGPWLGRARDQLAGISRAVAERPAAAVNSVHAVIEFMRIEGGASGLAFGDAVDPEADRAGATSSASVVEIFADEETLVVGDDAPASLMLGFRIKPGYHILAADPVGAGGDAAGLVPLRVGLVSGQGVAVYGDYPAGEAHGAGITGSDDLRGHTGEVRLPVAIEKKPGVGASEGEPVLGVTFQACDDSSCLKPATVRLGVAIRVE
jgi:uncharacterized protein YyaL (SSP411 family)